MSIVRSKNGVPVRLTYERWFHITEEHSEVAGYFYEVLETISEPEAVFQGASKELLATREIEPGKHMVVFYKELSEKDGFIITAFLTRRMKKIERRTKLWPL